MRRRRPRQQEKLDWHRCQRDRETLTNATAAVAAHLDADKGCVSMLAGSMQTGVSAVLSFGERILQRNTLALSSERCVSLAPAALLAKRGVGTGHYSKSWAKPSPVQQGQRSFPSPDYL